MDKSNIYLSFLWTFPLAHKSQFPSTFFSFHQYICTQFDKYVKCFQCDNGKKFDNLSLSNFSVSNRVHLCFLCPYISPHTSRAERQICTLNDIICNLLTHSSVPPSLWPRALQMATTLHNILPTKILKFSTLTFLLYNKILS